MPRAGTGVGRAAALLTVLASASAVLGFGRDVVVAAVFGAGAELDAFLLAQGMMNLVLGLVSSPVATALVPVIAREATGKDGARRANHTVTVALSVTLVVLGRAPVLLWLFAGPAVSALGAGIAQVTLAALSVWAVFVLVLRALRVAEVEVIRDALALIRRRRG